MAHDRRSFFRRVVGAAAALVAVPACLRRKPPEVFGGVDLANGPDEIWPEDMGDEDIFRVVRLRREAFYRDTADNLTDKLWGEGTEPKVPFGMEHLSI